MKPNNTSTARRWVLQALPARPGYPDWRPWAIRDATTNVHIATVGNMDRYYEDEAADHADLIVRAVNNHDALVAALERWERWAERAQGTFTIADVQGIVSDTCAALAAAREGGRP